MALFIEGAEEGAGHSENSWGVGETAEQKSKGGVNGEVHHLVIRQMKTAIDLLDAVGWQGGDAQDEGIEGQNGEKVFPWQLSHKEGILGVE